MWGRLPSLPIRLLSFCRVGSAHQLPGKPEEDLWWAQPTLRIMATSAENPQSRKKRQLLAVITAVAVLLVVVGLLYEWVEMFVDIALALFLLNFVATLLVARYVNERRKERT